MTILAIETLAKNVPPPKLHFVNNNSRLLYSQLIRLYCVLNALLFSLPLFAHTTPEELSKIVQSSSALKYLVLGYQHILPYGFDHILFIISLVLLSPKLKPVLWQTVAFTVAHSVSLGLTMQQVIVAPQHIVEPLIAFSILYLALENIFSTKLRISRIGIIFLFGLLHGMGFADGLRAAGLPENSYWTSLFMFNAGVELGQVTVIILMYFFLIRWFSSKPYYHKRIVIPVSLLVAIISGFLIISRF